MMESILSSDGGKREIAMKTAENTCRRNTAPTKLKTRRVAAGYTQKGRADRCTVSLRTIQQYEQRTKDINKAAGISLHSIALVLDCQMEDLLE